MCAAFTIVILQHGVLKKCVLNEMHGVDEKEDHTIYSAILEECGFTIPRKPLKKFVRTYLYAILAVFTVVLQMVFHFEPLLF